jgi:hypothetical protein
VLRSDLQANFEFSRREIERIGSNDPSRLICGHSATNTNLAEYPRSSSDRILLSAQRGSYFIPSRKKEIFLSGQPFPQKV